MVDEARPIRTTFIPLDLKFRSEKVKGRDDPRWASEWRWKGNVRQSTGNVSSHAGTRTLRVESVAFILVGVLLPLIFWRPARPRTRNRAHSHGQPPAYVAGGQLVVAYRSGGLQKTWRESREQMHLSRLVDASRARHTSCWRVISGLFSPGLSKSARSQLLCSNSVSSPAHRTVYRSGQDS